MRLSELYGAPVCNLDDRKMGRLFEIYVIGDEVEAIGCGAGSCSNGSPAATTGGAFPGSPSARSARAGS